MCSTVLCIIPPNFRLIAEILKESDRSLRSRWTDRRTTPGTPCIFVHEMWALWKPKAIQGRPSVCLSVCLTDKQTDYSYHGHKAINWASVDALSLIHQLTRNWILQQYKISEEFELWVKIGSKMEPRPWVDRYMTARMFAYSYHKHDKHSKQMTEIMCASLRGSCVTR